MCPIRTDGCGIKSEGLKPKFFEHSEVFPLREVGFKFSDQGKSENDQDSDGNQRVPTEVGHYTKSSGSQNGRCCEQCGIDPGNSNGSKNTDALVGRQRSAHGKSKSDQNRDRYQKIPTARRHYPEGGYRCQNSSGGDQRRIDPRNGNDSEDTSVMIARHCKTFRGPGFLAQLLYFSLRITEAPSPRAVDEIA